jgi:hypothetical protein
LKIKKMYRSEKANLENARPTSWCCQSALILIKHVKVENCSTSYGGNSLQHHKPIFNQRWVSCKSPKCWKSGVDGFDKE